MKPPGSWAVRGYPASTKRGRASCRVSSSGGPAGGTARVSPAYRDKDREVVYSLAGVRVPRPVVPGINGFHMPPIVDPPEPGWRGVEVDQPVGFIWSTPHEAAAGYFMQCERY